VDVDLRLGDASTAGNLADADLWWLAGLQLGFNHVEDSLANVRHCSS
jgi:hypothetical protein